VIRPAKTRDADRIAGVHVRAWQAGYASVLPVEALARLSAEERASTWREGISAGQTILVAEEGGLIEGFVAVGSARDGDARGLGELYAIYVEPAHWGHGFGRELLRAAEEVLRGSGFAEAILWVLEENPRARRFYEASDWRVETTRRIDVLGAKVAEVRYRKRL
jgi:ribosomal protein S18 acetylase RimI-like enzyme